ETCFGAQMGHDSASMLPLRNTLRAFAKGRIEKKYLRSAARRSNQPRRPEKVIFAKRTTAKPGPTGTAYAGSFGEKVLRASPRIDLRIFSAADIPSRIAL